MIVSYFIIYSSFDSVNSDGYPIQVRIQIEIQTKISHRFKRACSGFSTFTIIKYAYNYRVVMKIKIELRKREWAIRDRLVVPFEDEEGRDEEINIQRETRCPGR